MKRLVGQDRNEIRIAHADLVPWEFENPVTNEQSTDGKAVQVRAIDVLLGTDQLIGSGSGAVPGTPFTIDCDFSLVTADRQYEIQAAADPTATNPIPVIPNPETPDRVYVFVYSTVFPTTP